MTANELIRRLQQKVNMLSSGDVPIKYNGEDMDVYIELIEGYNGYYINIVSSQDEPNAEETELNSLAFLEQLGYTCIPPKESWPPQDNTPTYASTEYKVSKELTTNQNMDSSDAKCGQLTNPYSKYARVFRQLYDAGLPCGSRPTKIAQSWTGSDGKKYARSNGISALAGEPETLYEKMDSVAEEKSEIPTNLEQEVYNYCYDNFVYDNDEDGWYSTDKLATIIREDMIELARHFAEWGRNHLTIDSLSEELIDASNDYTLNIRKGYPRVKDETDRYISNAFIDGAEWQKKQDQETIELAEDHAMMAGRIKAKEEFDQKCQGCFDRDEVFRKGVLRGAKEQKKQDEIEFCYEEAFDNGVKYTKEQMLKDAVEGSVIVAYIAPSGEQYGNIVSTDVEIDRFSLNEGDKVKLIILKDDGENS